MPKVYNKYHKDAPKDAVYIGRPSKWGNPYKVGDPNPEPDAVKSKLGRGEAVAWFRYYLAHKPELVAAIKKELKGKDLVCFCAPKPCHGDVLLEIANNGDNDD